MGRSYSGRFLRTLKGGKTLTQDTNTACWAGVAYAYTAGISLSKGTFVDDTIYIHPYEYMKELKKYEPLLLKTINEITPCEWVEIGNKKYIKFKLTENYNTCLFLLSCIRNLWFEHEGYGSYCKAFFEALESSKQKDPVSKLTEANIASAKSVTLKGYIGPGHCNLYGGGKIRNLKFFNEFKGTSVYNFLTQ